MNFTASDLERIEREVTFVPKEDECVCNWCGTDYSLDDGKEPSALCHSCAQEFVTIETPGLIALARRALELESALAYLAKLERYVSHGPDGEADCWVTADAVIAESRELGWPGLQSEGGKEQDG